MGEREREGGGGERTKREGIKTHSSDMEGSLRRAARGGGGVGTEKGTFLPPATGIAAARSEGVKGWVLCMPSIPFLSKLTLTAPLPHFRPKHGRDPC